MALGVDAGTRPVDFTPGPGEGRLDVGIIGAGIAGLGAAVALGQAGHNVEVSQYLLHSAPLEIVSGVVFSQHRMNANKLSA